MTHFFGMSSSTISSEKSLLTLQFDNFRLRYKFALIDC